MLHSEKLVSAAGIAPAIPRSQAERVAATLRAAGSGVAVDAGAGDHETFNPGNGLAVRF